MGSIDDYFPTNPYGGANHPLAEGVNAALKAYGRGRGARGAAGVQLEDALDKRYAKIQSEIAGDTMAAAMPFIDFNSDGQPILNSKARTPDGKYTPEFLTAASIALKGTPGLLEVTKEDGKLGRLKNFNITYNENNKLTGTVEREDKKGLFPITLFKSEDPTDLVAEHTEEDLEQIFVNTIRRAEKYGGFQDSRVAGAAARMAIQDRGPSGSNIFHDAQDVGVSQVDASDLQPAAKMELVKLIEGAKSLEDLRQPFTVLGQEKLLAQLIQEREKEAENERKRITQTRGQFEEKGLPEDQMRSTLNRKLGTRAQIMENRTINEAVTDPEMKKLYTPDLVSQLAQRMERNQDVKDVFQRSLETDEANDLPAGSTFYDQYLKDAPISDDTIFTEVGVGTGALGPVSDPGAVATSQADYAAKRIAEEAPEVDPRFDMADLPIGSDAKYDKEGNLIPTRVVPAFKPVPKREADGTVIPNETNVEMTYKAFEDGLTQIEETPDDPGLLGSAKEFLRDPTNIDLLAQKYRPGTAENRRLTSLLRDNDVTTVSDINRLSNANQVRIASFIISSIPEKDRGNMVDNIFKAINLLRTGDPKRTGADEARDERTARKSLRAENLQEREFNFKVQELKQRIREFERNKRNKNQKVGFPPQNLIDASDAIVDWKVDPDNVNASFKRFEKDLQKLFNLERLSTNSDEKAREQVSTVLYSGLFKFLGLAGRYLDPEWDVPFFGSSGQFDADRLVGQIVDTFIPEFSDETENPIMSKNKGKKIRKISSLRFRKPGGQGNYVTELNMGELESLAPGLLRQINEVIASEFPEGTVASSE